MSTREAPSADLVSRVAGLMRRRPISWRRSEGGYSPAGRWVVRLDDGSTCFVKVATDDHTRQALRDEYEKVYGRLEAPFLPRVLAYDDREGQPILALEDLSRAHWPPPWSAHQVERVRELLYAFRALSPDWLPRHGRIEGWTVVAADASGFLALGVCTEAWLTASLPSLLEADAAAVWEGDELNHFDVRSDNLCFDGERLLLLDWNHACLANGDIDLAFWLPSLALEGGPLPEAVLPESPELAATVAGFYAARAGVFVPGSPLVWEHRQRMLRQALPWAIRALGLPPLDGKPAT